MELTSLSREGYSSKTGKVVYIFAYVYIALVVLSCICYMLAGMNFYEAICHAMGVISTGGFSTRNNSIASFDSRAIEAVTMFFMYVSSLHFGVLYLSVVSRSLKPLNNPVFKTYTIVIVVIALLISAGLKGNGECRGWGEALWCGLFSTLSVSTTTGFAIVDNVTWPVWMIQLLAILGIMCGSSGATCSGIKVDRALLLFKSIGKYVNNILHPSSVNEIRLGRKILRDDEVYPHILYIALYILVIIISTLLLGLTGMGFEDSCVSSVVSLSNLGPASGSFGNMGNFNSAPMISKFILTLDMFLGRIEIYPVMAVVGMLFSRRKR